MAPENDRTSSCLKVLGCGCFVLIALAAVGGFGGWWWFGNLAKSAEVAEETRKELDERYGALGEWSPDPDWSLEADRLDAFLRIRSGLMEECAEISEFFGRIGELDALAESGEEPGALEALSIVGPAMQLPRRMLRFVEERNRLLAAEEMGLGEYAFLYVLTLHGGEPAAEAESSVVDDAVTDDDVREAFVASLAAVAESVEVGDPELAGELAAELDRLRTVGWLAVFPDGLPAPWAEVVEDRRDRLETTRCAAAAEVALSVAERRGASIRFE